MDRNIWMYPLLLAICHAITFRPTCCFYKPPLGPYHGAHRGPMLEDHGRDLLSKCKLRWHNTTLDHFSYAKPEKGPGWFQQRYFVCDEHWRPTSDGFRGPIFFYVGNEADVTLYLNHTGLMWENAEAFGALLVFAEHRYYGLSKPFHKGLRHHMGYLMAEQALADYAELLRHIQEEAGAVGVPVIGFGGSYGGMLATWMRLKYPHVLAGAIAGSAPIWNFLGEDPPYDDNSFAAGVTYDASEAGGSAPACVDNVRRAWKVLMSLAQTKSGRTTLSSALRLCPNSRLTSPADAPALRGWLGAAWDFMAMGNYPYPSSYILNGRGQLPAFPVRVACQELADPHLRGEQLMRALGAAVGVFYNASGGLDCFDTKGGPNPETDEDGDFWDYQWCSEMFMPASKDGEADMFWAEPWDLAAALTGCRQSQGVTPHSTTWADTQWGGRAIAAGSNIVWSNGLLDPWHGGGVLTSLSESLVAVIIPEGAHHLDLMFSHPLDPPGVQAARVVEVHHMWQWVKQGYQQLRQRKQQGWAAATTGGKQAGVAHS